MLCRGSNNTFIMAAKMVQKQNQLRLINISATTLKDKKGAPKSQPKETNDKTKNPEKMEGGYGGGNKINNDSSQKNSSNKDGSSNKGKK